MRWRLTPMLSLKMEEACLVDLQEVALETPWKAWLKKCRSKVKVSCLRLWAQFQESMKQLHSVRSWEAWTNTTLTWSSLIQLQLDILSDSLTSQRFWRRVLSNLLSLRRSSVACSQLWVEWQEVHKVILKQSIKSSLRPWTTSKRKSRKSITSLKTHKRQPLSQYASLSSCPCTKQKDLRLN